MSYNILNFMKIRFDNPLLFLLLIPAALVVLIPYFRLPKKYRLSRNKIVPTVVHIVILFLTVTILTGFTFFSERDPDKQDVVVLVDYSHSTNTSRKAINRCVGEVIDELNGNSNVAILSFGNDVVSGMSISSNVNKVYSDFINSKKLPDTDGSNIANALTKAGEILERSHQARIVLISDGLETQDSAIITAKSLAQKKIKVDCINFSPNTYEEEMQVIGIEYPETVFIGDVFEFEVIVQSVGITNARISLSETVNRTDKSIGTKEVKLKNGINRISFEYNLILSGIHTLKAVASADEDSVSENNVFYSYLDVDDNKRILVIQGQTGEYTALGKIIEPYYLDNIDKVYTNELPTNISELLKYSEVILMNVNYDDLDDNFALMLEQYVYNYGGGLFTTGGKNTYTKGNMAGTLFDQILPIESIAEDKNMAILYVLDASGSMAGARMANAKKAILESLPLLNEGENAEKDNYIGLISFNTRQPIDRLSVFSDSDNGFISSHRTDEIKAAVEGINTVTGTYYYNAIKMAIDNLTNFKKASMRHIVFLSDGAADDAGSTYKKLISAAAEDKNITFSTIGLETSADAKAELEKMAEMGRGRFSECNAANVIDVMRQETSVAVALDINEMEFQPYVRSTAVDLITFSYEDMPSLKGFVGTTAKADSKVVLSSTYNDPIYSEWYYGEGKVGCFMSTLNGDEWSKDFMENSNGKRFILNVVKSLLSPKKMGADFTIEFERNNFTTAIRVNTDIGDNENVKISITPPGGRPQGKDLVRTSSSLYLGNFDTDVPGLYTINISKNRDGRLYSEAVTYFAFSYSAEYNTFANYVEGANLLTEIARLTQGKVVESNNLNDDNTFVPNMEPIEDIYDPRPILLITALILFLLEIIARKFKFKWPHEWFKKEEISID